MWGSGLRERLYGNEQKGFEIMQEVLSEGKLSKWPLMTIIPVYFNPTHDVFIKPTAVKNTIAFLEIEDLVYKPTPSWKFYSEYRSIINAIKGKYPAFSSYNFKTIYKK